MNIREIHIDDAAALHELNLCLDVESAFMMLEPGERTTSVEQTRDRIAGWQSADNQVMFVLASEEALAGYIVCMGGPYKRNRQTASIVMGLRAAYCRQGHGTRLMHTAEAWAREHAIHRLQLTVMAHNEAAIGLYRKCGFDVEGVLRDRLRVAGAFVDELAMAKILM